MAKLFIWPPLEVVGTDQTCAARRSLSLVRPRHMTTDRASAQMNLTDSVLGEPWSRDWFHFWFCERTRSWRVRVLLVTYGGPPRVQIHGHRIGHGCARVAHCAIARWRNYSHYCCPLRQYDVWVTYSEHREALAGAPTAHNVHKQEFTVQGGEQVGRLRCVTAVDGGIEAFPFSIVICAPMG